MYDDCLTAVESKLAFAGEFPEVIYTLNLRRQRLYYVVNLIMPCFLLSLIALATFILQPSSGDRLGIGMSLSISDYWHKL